MRPRSLSSPYLNLFPPCLNLLPPIPAQPPSVVRSTRPAVPTPASSRSRHRAPSRRPLRCSSQGSRISHKGERDMAVGEPGYATPLNSIILPVEISLVVFCFLREPSPTLLIAEAGAQPKLIHASPRRRPWMRPAPTYSAPPAITPAWRRLGPNSRCSSCFPSQRRPPKLCRPWPCRWHQQRQAFLMQGGGLRPSSSGSW